MYQHCVVLHLAAFLFSFISFCPRPLLDRDGISVFAAAREQPESK